MNEKMLKRAIMKEIQKIINEDIGFNTINKGIGDIGSAVERYASGGKLGKNTINKGIGDIGSAVERYASGGKLGKIRLNDLQTAQKALERIHYGLNELLETGDESTKSQIRSFSKIIGQAVTVTANLIILHNKG